MPGLLLLATTNPGKLAELRALVLGAGAPLTDLAELRLDLTVPEDGDSYAEIALTKAAAYAAASGLWTLADDTGLEVDALNGAPGVRSARLAGDDETRRRKLLARLAPFPRPWAARFRCSIVLASPDGASAVGHGTCEGEIIPEARGEHGFGYDPIFLVTGTRRTMAELRLAEKNVVSHRARAVADLRRALREGALSGAPLTG
ncbi:MAG TPA: RdgB/HAM1 family non-canonical purine NTP pyrophosphatase [Anaerolineales bacterium]|nr:RdgB/HAM1 family non-canonical purine NTP pyrophosphatase [Anaerolineales bacterium]